MPKMHEILAVERTLESQVKKIRADSLHKRYHSGGPFSA